MQTLEPVDPMGVAPGLLVERVRQGDSAGVEELRRLLSRGIRFLVARKLPATEVDGCVGEVLDHVVRGIQSGDLGNPARLGQYVRMHLTTHIREAQDKQPAIQHACKTASAPCASDQHREVMQALLLGLSLCERESLIRFYVNGHGEEQICRELCMPVADFRTLRVRVNSRFHELCQQGAGGVAE